MAPCDFQRYID